MENIPEIVEQLKAIDLTLVLIMCTMWVLVIVTIITR